LFYITHWWSINCPSLWKPTYISSKDQKQLDWSRHWSRVECCI